MTDPISWKLMVPTKSSKGWLSKGLGASKLMGIISTSTGETGEIGGVRGELGLVVRDIVWVGVRQGKSEKRSEVVQVLTYEKKNKG